MGRMGRMRRKIAGPGQNSTALLLSYRTVTHGEPAVRSYSGSHGTTHLYKVFWEAWS